MKRVQFFAAAGDEQPYLTDSNGNVYGVVYLAEQGEIRIDAIHNAARYCIESGHVVFAYDADQTYLGSAYVEPDGV